MKQQNHLYNALTERLRKAQPQPSSPETLTARIMDNIRSLPQQQARRNTKRALQRTLAGLAAVVVLGLLVYEITRPAEIRPDEYALHNVTPPDAPATYTRTEKIKLYIQWKQAQQKRQEEKRNSLISLKYKYTRS